MSKKNTITIDLDYWTTQARKAEIDNVRPQYIRQRVVRSIAGQTKDKFIETWHIPELGITLVPKDAK
jgi:hypothetical protein